MKPVMGQIVILNYERGIAPALVQSVNEDETVNLFVFGPDGQHMISNVTEGDGVGQWSCLVKDSSVIPVHSADSTGTVLLDEVAEIMEKSTKSKK